MEMELMSASVGRSVLIYVELRKKTAVSGKYKRT